VQIFGIDLENKQAKHSELMGYQQENIRFSQQGQNLTV
jgi:CRISPR/Cas system CMR-associated protein Cmr3 (group 5 of RAMP superfamily)